MRSESFSKRLELPRRGYLSFSLKNTVFGLFLLCSCVLLFFHDVRYGPLVLQMFQEDQASALPGVIGAGPLTYHNATDQVIEEKSDQEFEVGNGNLQNSTSGALSSPTFHCNHT